MKPFFGNFYRHLAIFFWSHFFVAALIGQIIMLFIFVLLKQQLPKIPVELSGIGTVNFREKAIVLTTCTPTFKNVYLSLFKQKCNFCNK